MVSKTPRKLLGVLFILMHVRTYMYILYESLSPIYILLSHTAMNNSVWRYRPKQHRLSHGVLMSIYKIENVSSILLKVKWKIQKKKFVSVKNTRIS